jgi:hypothetical protein
MRIRGRKEVIMRPTNEEGGVAKFKGYDKVQFKVTTFHTTTSEAGCYTIFIFVGVFFFWYTHPFRDVVMW